MSATTELAAIDSAIAQILTGGQEYTMGGRRHRRAELRDLQAEKRRLEAQIAAESDGNTMVAYFDKR